MIRYQPRVSMADADGLVYVLHDNDIMMNMVA